MLPAEPRAHGRRSLAESGGSVGATLPSRRDTVNRAGERDATPSTESGEPAPGPSPPPRAIRSFRRLRGQRHEPAPLSGDRAALRNPASIGSRGGAAVGTATARDP